MKKSIMILLLALLASTQLQALTIKGLGPHGLHEFWFSAQEFWNIKDYTDQYLDDYIKVGMRAKQVANDETLYRYFPELWQMMASRDLASSHWTVTKIMDEVGDRNERSYPNQWVWGFRIEMNNRIENM